MTTWLWSFEHSSIQKSSLFKREHVPCFLFEKFPVTLAEEIIIPAHCALSCTLGSSFVGKMSPGVVLTRSVHGRDQLGCQTQGLAAWRVFWLWLQTFKSCWLKISLKPACVYLPSLFPFLFNPKTAVHCSGVELMTDWKECFYNLGCSKRIWEEGGPVN